MHITLEGIDRCGKGSLHRYLERLGNFAYIIDDRGILTQLVYNDKFSRAINYNIDNYKNDLIIYLYAEHEDLEIRFKMTNEPSLNTNKSLIEGINDDLELYDKHLKCLLEKGFKVLAYNTSLMTPYQIAKSVLKELNELEEKGEFIL